MLPAILILVYRLPAQPLPVAKHTLLVRFGIIELEAGTGEEIIPDEVLIALTALHAYEPAWIEDDDLWNRLKNSLNLDVFKAPSHPGESLSINILQHCLERKQEMGVHFSDFTDEHRLRLLRLMGQVKMS
ncbi:MAG: hypothetical protein KAW12_03450 [Candidatus Aminicenantes bacterium]|nr:hypothetical protein [Candidatus Aminicenantes bacterium]